MTAEASRRYRQRHPERIAAAAKAYNERNREARNAYKRQRYAEGKDRPKESKAAYLRDWRLRKVYGISQGEFEILLSSQEGACAICRATGKELRVDHDHRSGKVRGLLCHHCNTALGMAGDDVERLMAMAAYLLEGSS